MKKILLTLMTTTFLASCTYQYTGSGKFDEEIIRDTKQFESYKNTKIHIDVDHECTSTGHGDFKTVNCTNAHDVEMLQEIFKEYGYKLYRDEKEGDSKKSLRIKLSANYGFVSLLTFFSSALTVGVLPIWDQSGIQIEYRNDNYSVKEKETMNSLSSIVFIPFGDGDITKSTIKKNMLRSVIEKAIKDGAL